MRTKWSYAESVINELQNDYPGRDLKIDPREVLIRLDAKVNAMAKQGYLENWKMGHGANVDEQFVTTWENIVVTDPGSGQPSYFTIPANYANLPRNGGIEQVYFMNPYSGNKTRYFDPVIIKSFRDVAAYRNNMAGNLEGRVSGYPKGRTFIFDRGNIFAKYGNAAIRLVIRDSSAIGDSDPYPLPADIEDQVIAELVDWFRERRAQPTDTIKDANDKP
jgi:hypothetical protein